MIDTQTDENREIFRNCAKTIVEEIFGFHPRSDRIMAQKALELLMRCIYFKLDSPPMPDEVSPLMVLPVNPGVRALTVAISVKVEQAISIMSAVEYHYKDIPEVYADAVRRAMRAA